MTQPQDNLVLFLAEILTKQNATTEEKKIQALIKTALYSDNLLQFINEVSNAFNGCGKVKVDTVKGVTEYFKANSEDRIRSSIIVMIMKISNVKLKKQPTASHEAKFGYSEPWLI